MVKRLLAAFFLLKNALLDFIFPPVCFGCDKDIESGFICDKCYTKVTTTALGVCPICGMPKDYDDKCRHILFHNREKINKLTRIRALGKYLPPYLGLIHNFKYYHKKKVAKVLGLGLTNLINSDPILSRADYLTPIPLHPARLRERGFNQSLLLAHETALGSGIKLNDCLRRKRNTKSQTSYDHQKRISNVANAFALKPKLELPIKDRKVILIDDVITTGATLVEAADTLIKNGASEVYAVTVATA
ncbi:MAG: ComF family protein [candidate division WOR-3 bacterium]|nr:ComF family protein [candidate division WOR-3 bacterium]